ncbi:MAG TPA: HAMP domain-containing sensor histidine kinase [Caulobacteraceae bacterium]|nr:HAMP domain-containing sensor histidine kinase [Caulobacteraceae bacterium]
MSSPTLGALALGAAPGLLGYFWRPTGQARPVLLVAWALAAVAAAAIAGGATGPLAAWCVTPLLAGALIGMPAEGAVLAAAALATTVLVQMSGMALPAPSGPFGVGLAAAGLLTLGGAAAGALGLVARRGREQQALAEEDQAWMSGVMSDLPHLALALDREGRVEAMFGAALPGLEIHRLREGLRAAAAEDDRDAIRAAIFETLDRGAGQTAFKPAAAPDAPVILSMRRRGDDGIVALVRHLASVPADVAGSGTNAPPAEARAAALDQQLRAAETARDQAIEALGQAQAARIEADTGRENALALANARSRFLANMSHELRTPLNAIMGFSDIMRSRMFGDLSAKYGEYAELIHESGRYLTDLINDVLDMSKIEADRYTLDLDLFDAREPVSGALRLMRLQADEAGVQLRGVLPQQAVMVDADRRALKQIVLNLVSNALKFTPGGGSITVTVQAVGDALELMVADTGVGIAREDLERLGRPYEQAGDAEHKAQGTGLGLSLVKAFAGLHGGEMTIESELGEGAAVTVRLPVLHHDAAPKPEVRPEPASKPGTSQAPQVRDEDFAAPPAVGNGVQAGPSTTEEDAPRAAMASPPHSAEIIPLNLPR